MVFGEYRYIAPVLLLLLCPLVVLVHYMKHWGISDMVGIQWQLKQLAKAFVLLLLPLLVTQMMVDKKAANIEWSSLSVALGLLLMGCCFALV